jgi:hypothetical protein
MRFYTEEQCKGWLAKHGREKPRESPGLHKLHVHYHAQPQKLFFLADWVSSALPCREPTLVWITEWGIWSANWHLYYKLRQSYGDYQLLEEAPGHLFLDYESKDLASFLQVAMLNGWDGYILTTLDHVNAFFSHDEYIDFFSEDESNLNDARSAFKDLIVNHD